MSVTYRHGFTLIELSIVLVIIGLLVGGVLVGRDLIKSAEIRAQISQIEEFKTAVNTFKVKYGYLPGDMPPTQASQLGFFTFIGTYAGKSCTWGAGGGFGAQFGDNDGMISQEEFLAFWSHLSDAKLIKGSYGGRAGNLLSSSASICTNTGGGYSGTDWALVAPPQKLSNATGSYVAVASNMIYAPVETWIFYQSHSIIF